MALDPTVKNASRVVRNCLQSFWTSLSLTNIQMWRPLSASGTPWPECIDVNELTSCLEFFGIDDYFIGIGGRGPTNLTRSIPGVKVIIQYSDLVKLEPRMPGTVASIRKFKHYLEQEND